MATAWGPGLLMMGAMAACATSPAAPPTKPALTPPQESTPKMQPPRAAAPSALVVAQRIEHLDAPSREPMLVEHPGGALFVAGYGGDTPTLWKSDDRGATWARVDVGTEGATGNSDVDLAVAGDGTLYFASMTYDREKKEGVQIAVGVSHDVGATWSWTRLSHHRFDDRPWVAVAPDGTAHAIWNDGDGVNHAVSHDSGATWQTRARVNDAGGSSHLAVGPRGEVAVRVVPPSASGNKRSPGVDLIAVSTDGGETFARHPAPGVREYHKVGDEDPAVVPRWVEPLAWDAGGALYSLWGDMGGVWLARSTDRGEHWQTWRIASGRSFYPYLVAGAAGELAASWYTGSGEDITWNVARVAVAADGAPRVVAAPPQQLECFHRKLLTRAACGEYQGLTLLRDSTVAAATTIQNVAAKRFGFVWLRFEAP